VLHTFTGPEGSSPSGNLIFDGAGNLYGVTSGGGDYGKGVVFELTPAPGGWTYAVLYSFKGGLDGEFPVGKPALDALGNLYGATAGGGARNCGTVYQLAPAQDGWSENVLYAFTCGKDGANPEAGVTLGSKGNLYGTTFDAGSFSGPCGSWQGCGTIFKLQALPGRGWKFKVLHTFQGKGDGTNPQSTLTWDTAGNLYGTAMGAGAKGFGTVYQLSPAPFNGELRRFRLLHYFRGVDDGANPGGAVIFDAAGNAYATTMSGGGNDNSAAGTVYQLIPTPKGQWKFNLLYTFAGDNMGGAEDLTIDGNGILYGAAGVGSGWGGIFELAPTPSGSWDWSVVYTFSNVADGAYAWGVVLDSNGNFFGTTGGGGAYYDGVVFEIKR
jgi:uncharacterized repeat protein (TIGR03803 family)